MYYFIAVIFLNIYLYIIYSLTIIILSKVLNTGFRFDINQEPWASEYHGT